MKPWPPSSGRKLAGYVAVNITGPPCECRVASTCRTVDRAKFLSNHLPCSIPAPSFRNPQSLTSVGRRYSWTLVCTLHRKRPRSRQEWGHFVAHLPPIPVVHRLFICQNLYWTLSMPRILPILGLALALRCGAFAQTPRARAHPDLAGRHGRAPRPTASNCSPPISPRASRAKIKVQAKAALLPSVNWQNGFIYTQPNGTDTGVLRRQRRAARLHQHGHRARRCFRPRQARRLSDGHRRRSHRARQSRNRGPRPDRHRRAEFLRHGGRRSATCQRAAQPAGSAAVRRYHAEAGGRRRGGALRRGQSAAQLDQRAARRAGGATRLRQSPHRLRRLPLPRFPPGLHRRRRSGQPRPLAAFPEIEALARNNNPDIRAAQAAITQQTYGIKSARAGLLPTLSVDYFFGLNANQYALHNEFGQNNLGSSVVASLNVPVWTWGADAQQGQAGRTAAPAGAASISASRSASCSPT